MRSDLFVYLSGPMTAKHGYIVEENVTAGVKVALELMAAGVPCMVPHLWGGFPSAWTAIPWEAWLEYDYASIDRCTHVVMLPRWASSSGAVKERDYALEKGVPVLELDEFRARYVERAA